MKIGLIREGKIPPDARILLTPAQCARVIASQAIQIVVEPSAHRCYTDEEYQRAGIALSKDFSDCDLLMGVKEVPVSQLIPGKTYCFFSHTIKKQPHNQKLLQAVLEKQIRMLDYEVMTNDKGERLIAFGRFAGKVGAHNALYAYGCRTGAFALKRMKDCHDYAEAMAIYRHIHWPAIKIVLTGGGRVGMGAAKVLRDMGIREVSASDFLQQQYQEAVFTQLHACDYIARNDGKAFDKADFYAHPEIHHSSFDPYFQTADIFINGIFWDDQSPAFFSIEDMRRPDFRIRVIADVTCDIAPLSSVPSTIRASTIADPIYGFDPFTNQETAPYQPYGIDVMAIDNLPNEMPRDASAAFGEQFIEHILPELLKPQSAIIERATIAENGCLTKHFEYLEDYVASVFIAR
ncbi:MAG: NAD(P)-dependent oxidoreductase [Saprospiraceae bacterium]|nr:NAD(P)-dependent oxidoreductase [Saprospiraceae bacterium]MDZ4705231.1 NAD(P)-dependent oxidoreductase [Saprospiraceae bacterium]